MTTFCSQTTTRTLLLIAVILFFLPVITAQNTSIKKPFPNAVHKKIRFGMTIENFADAFGDRIISVDTSMAFRTVIVQEVNSKDVGELVFYFDNDQDMPLYEIIVNYTSEEKARKEATRLLGAPNFNGNEWRYLYDDLPIWCWVYKNKIVYAAKITGSEWEEEWDDQ